MWVRREERPGSPYLPRRAGAVASEVSSEAPRGGRSATDSGSLTGECLAGARRESECAGAWSPRRVGRGLSWPRRPRRGRWLPCAERPGEGAVALFSAGSVSAAGADGSASSAEAWDSKAGSASAGATGTEISAGEVAPRRVALSCALVFQSARRNRSAAVRYQRPASAAFPVDSRKRASSNATMASRVLVKRFDSCPAGSFPVRARRIRAVICFQSAIQWRHSSSDCRSCQRIPGHRN